MFSSRIINMSNTAPSSSSCDGMMGLLPSTNLDVVPCDFDEFDLDLDFVLPWGNTIDVEEDHTEAKEISPNNVATPTEEDSSRPILHRLCQAFPTNQAVIQTALLIEPEAVGKPISLPVPSATARKQVASPIFKLFRSIKNNKKKANTRRDYQYPVNIAINNGASVEVVKLLAQAAPEVLLKPEGSQGHTSIHIALQKQPKNHQLIQILLDATPKAALAVTAYHQNTPLHTACQRGASLDVVRALYHANPMAVVQANFHGETPKSLAQRTLLCPEEVATFLSQGQ